MKIRTEIARWRRRLQALAGDEAGTSLTEFAITLPVFVAVMAFVYYVGAAGHVVSTEINEAHRGLWDDALEHTRAGHEPVVGGDPGQPHAAPGSAADKDQEFFSEHELRQRIDGLNEDVRGDEVSTYEGLGNGGHFGESYARTRRADESMRFANGADAMVSDPGDVVGGSEYTRELIDDSGGSFELGGGGTGPLAPAANFGLGQSVVPAVAAGIRYGVTHNVREGDVAFGEGWSFSVRFHFDTLVPPTPVGSQRTPAAVTRQKLESYQAYSELLGIANEQPLGAESAQEEPAWSP